MTAAGQKKLSFDASQLMDPVLAPLVSLISTSGGDKDVAAAVDNLAAAEAVLASSSLEEIAGLACLSQGKLRPSTALHFMFGRAPPELKSPHDSAGWSVSRYTQVLLPLSRNANTHM